MKTWKGLLSSALVLGSLLVSNVGYALTPGYYVRMDNDKLTGRLVILEHEGTLAIGDKEKKATLKMVSITDGTVEKDNVSLNAAYYDLKKNLAVTDKALVYYGPDYQNFITTSHNNFVRLYEEEDLLPFKLEEKDKDVIVVTSTSSRNEVYNGTYIRQETFYQATHPLTVFAIEQLSSLSSRDNITYMFEQPENDINYHVTAMDNGKEIAKFYVRLDLSKVRDENGYKNLFISNFARAYDAKQAKKAKG